MSTPTASLGISADLLPLFRARCVDDDLVSRAAGALHVLVPASNAIVPASVMTRYALMPASMTVGQVIGVFATLSF